MFRLSLGIVGCGFVGSAVANGFDTPNVDSWIVDPKKSTTTLRQLAEVGPHLTFICVPTPESTDGSVNVTIVDQVLDELNKFAYDGIVVIKSTITPDHLERFVQEYDLRIVYNPEFLTEANAHNDFINPAMQILGGVWEECEIVERAYVEFSKVKVVPTFKTDIVSASLLKYTINSWLATKVMFMNELHQLHKASGATTSWDQFTDMLQRDKRIGDTHLNVPGPDGKFGFGGHCFPKDTAGLLNYAKSKSCDLTVLDQAVTANKKIRNIH
jgi:UDPglucose 6-dehydrogenase